VLLYLQLTIHDIPNTPYPQYRVRIAIFPGCGLRWKIYTAVNRGSVEHSRGCLPLHDSCQEISLAVVNTRPQFVNLAANFSSLFVKLRIDHTNQQFAELDTCQEVPWKERKAVAADLRAVYASATLVEAEQALVRFSERWDAKYPAISPSWRADWQRLTVFFDYSPEIRKVIYTTNAVESLNYSLRKLLKTRGAFPNDEAIVKIIYLAISRVAKKWTMPIRDWKAALNQFVILFGDRVPV
jgi:transposase-like protein